MQLIDTLPETVYRVCDLIGVITNRNGAKWRDQALTSLVAEVSSEQSLCLLSITVFWSLIRRVICILHLIHTCKQIADISLRLMEAAQPLTTADTKSVQEWGNQLATLSEAPKLAVRLHLLSLLFEVSNDYNRVATSTRKHETFFFQSEKRREILRSVRENYFRKKGYLSSCKCFYQELTPN